MEVAIEGLQDRVVVLAPAAFIRFNRINPFDDPSIAIVEFLTQHIAIGDIAIALVAPIGPPGVANNEDLVGI